MVISTRRTLLAASGLIFLPGLTLAAAPTDNRLVLIILRGALDGLAAVPPIGDGRYAARRGALAFAPDGLVRLDQTFALHPALAPWGQLWADRQLLVIPATYGGHHSRSHFDAQDMLETGRDRPMGGSEGWLNRALADLQRDAASRRLGLALGDSVPLVLRGSVPVATWAPPTLKPAAPGLLAALSPLYAADPLLGPALKQGLAAEAMDDAVLGPASPEMKKGGRNALGSAGFRAAAEAAGGLLAADQGPRVAVLEIGGWDTHVAQGTTTGRLANTLTGLVEGVAALKARLGPAWSRTAVVCVTEFGRTVAPNGTNGTDHGTASVTLALGGAVRGGRILGDWPGLDRLEQDRDLRPTTDLRRVLKGVLRDHLGLDRDRLDRVVFPDSAAEAPLTGLVA